MNKTDILLKIFTTHSTQRAGEVHAIIHAEKTQARVTKRECQFGSLCFTSGNTQIQARAKKGEDYKDELSFNPSRSTERASLRERERRCEEGPSPLASLVVRDLAPGAPGWCRAASLLSAAVGSGGPW